MESVATTVSSPDGFIAINKPVGARSTDVVRAVRRVTRTRRVGHCGTLDPLAAGVVPVAIGRATRLSAYVLCAPKTYLAAILFGVRTTTDDLEGAIVGSPCPAPDTAGVLRVLPAFVGAIRQRPPATSAVRSDGRRAYERVRSGEAVVLDDREVEVHAIEPVATATAGVGSRAGRLVLGEAEATSRALLLAVEVHCGSGTYIRSLARDIGESVGCGATLLALVRTAVGPFALADAVELGALQRATPTELAAALHALDVVLEALPARIVSANDRANFVHGRRLAVEPAAPGLHRFYDSGGGFLGTAESTGQAWGKRRVMRSTT